MSLVTIVVLTRDRPEWLQRALWYCSQQTYDNIEVIVIDDASEPPAVIPDDPRFVLYRTEHVGMVANQNYSIDLAHGAYIVFNADDDYLRPTAIERLVCEAGSAEVTFADYDRIKPGGKIIAHTETEVCEEHMRIGPCVLWRRDVFDRVGGFDQSVEWASDYDLFARCYRAGMAFKHVPEPLMVYTDHGDSITGRHTKEQLRQADVIRERYDLPRIPRGK